MLVLLMAGAVVACYFDDDGKNGMRPGGRKNHSMPLAVPGSAGMRDSCIVFRLWQR